MSKDCSRFQAPVMMIIAWNNCVGGSSRSFKGKLRHSGLIILCSFRIQELKVLFEFISHSCTRKSLEPERHQEVIIKFLCSELLFYNTNEKEG